MRIDPNWFAVAPALTISEGEIDELYSLIDKSISDALERVHHEK